MANTLRVRRGNRADIPSLADGEIGYASDTGEFYTGTGSGMWRMTHQAWQSPVKDTVTSLPSSPSEGDRHLLSSDHSTHPNEIVEYISGTWNYYSPSEGWQVYREDINETIYYDGSKWVSSISEVTSSNWITPIHYDAYTFSPSDYPSSEPSFVRVLARTWDDGGAIPVTVGQMASPDVDYNPGYLKYDSTGVTMSAQNYFGFSYSPGSKSNFNSPGWLVRINTFTKTPDYNSGWFSVSAGNTYSKSHGIGAVPDFLHVELAQNSDGSGWRVPVMSSAYEVDSVFRQTGVVYLDSSTVKVRTHNKLAQFEYSGSQVPTSGYCRVLGYDWTPDYNSGWVSASSEDQYLFEHNLGREPSLIQIEVCGQTSSPSAPYNDFLLCQGQLLSDGNKGTQLYHLSDNFATVQSGGFGIARYVDDSGTGQTMTSGSVRFKAWV